MSSEFMPMALDSLARQQSARAAGSGASSRITEEELEELGIPVNKPGEKLPSVRDLAAVAAVNPNTMQKAFAELERSGLIMTQRTSGRTVTENTELISNTREKLAAGHMRNFIDNMQELGYDTGEIRELLAKMQS